MQGEKQVKYENIVYCDQMLAKMGNKDYIVENFAPECRGQQVYYFPNNTLRVGLQVMGVYENDVWLSMNNV